MKKDLELVFHWFTHPNGNQQSYLTEDGFQKVVEIQTALSTHAIDQATQISRRLFFVSTTNNLELGEILLRTAIYAVMLEEELYLQFAKEQIQRAAEAFINYDTHCRAFALWFVGYIYWQIPMCQGEAVRNWENSRHLLNILSYAHDTSSPDWYQKILFVIVQAFFNTKMIGRYYPLTKVNYPHLQSVDQPSAAKAVSLKPKSPNPRINIRSIPVYQYVRAGGWGVVDPDEVGYSELDHMIIDDTPHQIIGLPGHEQVTIQNHTQYALVRITGTSMNKFDIREGDYVLIRRQEDATHTEVVLAERIGIDAEATLKRLYKQGNTIELRPYSNDPHPVLPVDKRDNLRILGIAIAILKPVPPGNE